MGEETRLIVLASVQVIPNVVSALHYWKSGGLAAIHILYTDDNRHSRGPAGRLKKLFTELRAVAPFDNRAPAAVTLDDQPVGIEPQSVRERIARLIQTAPSARWVVNVTGGLKMMAFGGMGLPEPRPRIVYLERGEGWFVLEAEASGMVTARRDPELPGHAGSLLDAIPVESIVRTQFDGESFVFKHNGRPEPLDVAEFVRTAIVQRWDWGQIARQWEWAASSSADQSGGIAFERLIGAAVLRMEIDNVVWSLKIGDVHEMDLVLCHRGVVSLLDLKLRPPEEKNRPHAQIREAADAGSGIGGVDRKVIMLRPNWERNDETEALARARNVILITQEQAPQLFSVLAKLVGGTLDNNLEEAERLLGQSKVELGFAVAATSVARRLLAERKDDGIISIEEIFKAVCGTGNQNWMLWAHQQGLSLWVRLPGQEEDDSLRWPEIVKSREDLFRDAKFERSVTGARAYLTWRKDQLPRGKQGRIARVLNAARGRIIDAESLGQWYRP